MGIKDIRGSLENRLVTTIRRTQREATILFTDIEGSTRYWNSKGDIRGRLAVDRHNRLVFSVVRRCGGKVVKTIGDSVMASFRRPRDGVRAAIAIQQVLAREREENPDFRLYVRIGVHTGQAIVERGDVFGNAVNASARVESCARADEILLSGATVRHLGRGANRRYAIRRGERVVPRGQRRPITLYRVDWSSLADLFDGEGPGTLVTPEEKWLMVVYALGTLGGLWYLYAQYFRYMLIDSDIVAVLLLNPLQLLSHPFVGLAVAGLTLAFGLALWRMRRRPHGLLQALRGMAVFSLVFMAAHMAFGNWPSAWSPPRYWNETLYESEHLFVDVRQDRAGIREQPSREVEPMRDVRRGTLLLLADIVRRDEITWNRVLVGPDEYGWIPRVLPAEIGVPETRVSMADKFYFRWYDIHALAIGLLALLWSLRNFRLRPV